MTVVQINCSSTGSTGNIAQAIHKRLIDSGNKSVIFYGVGQAKEKNMYRLGNYFDLHLHAVLSRQFGLQGYFSYYPTFKLIRRIKQLSPDIVHLHNLHGSYLNLPMLFDFLKRSNIEMVITLHDCWLFTGKCPHFTVAGCEKWKDRCGNCPQLATYPRSKVDNTEKCLLDKKQWLTGFDGRMHIIAVSNWLCRIAKESYLSQYSIETIYNGIDGNIFRPTDGSKIRKKYNLEGKFIILGVSSNWNAQKGLDEFIGLSKELMSDEIIVLVGMTKEQISTMPDNIVGIMRTEDQQELAELYSEAGVFFNPSREETFGLVTAEAMACGTPVIVYDSTACAEIVNEDNGYIIDSMSSGRVMEYIRRVKTGHFKFQKLFSLEEMVEHYVDLYGRIC